MTQRALEGRTAVIAGGCNGLGLATALAFGAAGARMVITGRCRKALKHAMAQIGGGALAIGGDLAAPEHHDLVADEVRRRFGALDIYVANAGINTITPSSDVSEAEYDAQFAVNARGVFFGVRKLAPLIRNGGSIILVGALASGEVLEGHAVDAASKAALGAFARSWAVEFSSRRIRVNLLSPGPTDAALLGKLGVASEACGIFEKAAADAMPLGRVGRAEELAHAALFLASDASSFVTGIDLRADGGMARL